jgi:hypothetical protein
MSDYSFPKDWKHVRDEEVRACYCIGPQNGEPECPCRMRYRGGIALGYEDLLNLLERKRKPRVAAKS